MVERIYCIAILLGGMALFSTMIGGMSATIAQGQASVAGRLRREDLVQRFVDTYGIKPLVGARIVLFLKNRAHPNRRVVKDDIPALLSLPKSLRISMHYEMYKRTLTLSPVFVVLDSVDHLALSTVCDRDLSEQIYASEEDLFVFNAKGMFMRYIQDGTLSYHPQCSNDSLIESECQLPVNAGEIVSEAALWLDWTHQGLLRAETPSRTLNVHADGFARTLCEFGAGSAFGREYFSLFQDWASENDDLDDLSAPFSSVVALQLAGSNRHCRSFEIANPVRTTRKSSLIDE